MNRITLSAAVILGLALAGFAMAAPKLKLARHDISAKQCKTDSTAKKVVDVQFTLTDDFDQGDNGIWANDIIDRQLRIWKQDDGSFCAVIRDHGTFVTFAGESPGLSDMPIPAGIQGDFVCGWTVTDIQGTLDPAYGRKGELGTFDQMCSVDPSCPGALPTWESYFDHGVTGNDFDQWGWIYHAGSHGTWLTQDDEDSGDITS